MFECIGDITQGFLVHMEESSMGGRALLRASNKNLREGND